jgi:hypothetical protein
LDSCHLKRLASAVTLTEASHDTHPCTIGTLLAWGNDAWPGPCLFSRLGGNSAGASPEFILGPGLRGEVLPAGGPVARHASASRSPVHRRANECRRIQAQAHRLQMLRRLRQGCRPGCSNGRSILWKSMPAR